MDKNMEINYKLIGSRLYQARTSRKITLEEAGNKIGVNKSTVQRWENGNVEKFKIPLLEILADFYNVNPEWLMGRDVPMEETYMHFTPATVLVYGTIPAGIPLECIEDILDTEEIHSDMLKTGRQYFGLRVKGDSMEPDYIDGDTLIIEKQDDCESGDDCIVMVNGYDRNF